MPLEKVLLHCYHTGCGSKYDPDENTEKSCTYHPGAPFFHDAYKGWSCCKKKCTDFTEFLNIKGCTTSCHSNEKPEEPVKPVVDKSNVDEVIEVKPKVTERLERPPFDTPLKQLNHDVAASLRQQLEHLKIPSKTNANEEATSEIAVGTSCKHSGCKATYPDDSPCKYHSGSPIFHEGMKFWSCCNKKTSDFNAFLEQQGCTVDQHQWRQEKVNCRSSERLPQNEPLWWDAVLLQNIKKILAEQLQEVFYSSNGRIHKVAKIKDNQVSCRHDWHQTATHVIVTVFAKKYDPSKSFVKINPIRLAIHIFFPEEDSAFDLDLELRGIIQVEKCSAHMYGTKVEISLRKAEAGSWPKLDFSRTTTQSKDQSRKTEQNAENKNNDQLTDLSDLNDL